jgi:hypothetical protein
LFAFLFFGLCLFHWRSPTLKRLYQRYAEAPNTTFLLRQCFSGISEIRRWTPIAFGARASARFNVHLQGHVEAA